MATKKSATKKAASTESAAESVPAKKTAVKKVAAKKTADTTEQPKVAAKGAKAKPTQHDISVQAYLLWERDGKKHGHHDHYWQQAERELNS